MKDAVDEFCSLSKGIQKQFLRKFKYVFNIDQEEKTAVRKSFLKCLKDLHLHTVSELSSASTNAKNNSPQKGLRRAQTQLDKSNDSEEKDE